MRYQRPFTLLQRRAAIKAFKSYRAHLRLLQRKYPSRNSAERELLLDYAGHVDDMRSLLRLADAKVDVEALNRAEAWAVWTGTEYWRLRSAPSDEDIDG